MIKNLDPPVELLPLSGSGSDRSSVANDDSSPSQSTSSSSVLSKLVVCRVLPLVLFALIAGILILLVDMRYESEEALEDIEYKAQLLHTNATHHFNASEAHASNNHDIIWSRTRWKQLGTDCATDQRLANTTNLHCGFANNGKITIQPLIENESGMCGGVRLEANYCLMPSRGEWIWDHHQSSNKNETAAALPRRFGSYHPHVSVSEDEATNQTNQSLPLCKTSQDIYDGNQQGSPDNFDREWVPNSCSLVPLNPFTWMENSKCQVTIVMMGDSHIRNLFTATVHGLRGSTAFAEAHAGNDAKGNGIILTYEWRKDIDGNASDHYKVHQNTHNQTDFTSLFDDCPCNEDINARCLRIAFIWAPHFAEQVQHVQLVNDLNADLVIVEPGNSYEMTTVLSNEWISAMEAILQPNEDRHLAILHFPYPFGKQPKGRPEAIEAWISSNNNNITTATTEHTRNQISYLQQGKFGFGEMQSRKTFHYACGLGRIQVRSDVIQSIEMCTDEADTAYIRAITTLHFDAFGIQTR